jgi:hypothetical protein
MTPEQLQHHHDVLNEFIEAIETGEPIPNDLAAAVWDSWQQIDRAAAISLENMECTINTLQGELHDHAFFSMTVRGTA